jgi:hypothetical protein
MLAILPMISHMVKVWCSFLINTILGISRMGPCREMGSGEITNMRNMLEAGRITKLMAMESMLLKKVIIRVLIFFIEVNSQTLLNTVTAFKTLPMETFTKDTIFMVSPTEKVNIFGLEEPPTKANL